MDITEEHYKIFFGKSAGYYYDKLLDYRHGRRFTFNFFAFIFGLFWLLYRKLYRQTLLFMAIIFGTTLAEAFILSHLQAPPETAAIIDRITILVWASVWGITGNYLYLKHADKSVKAAALSYTNETFFREKLRRSGGTTLLPHFIILVLIALLVVLAKFELLPAEMY